MAQAPTPKFAARVLATQALYQTEIRGEVQADSTIAEFLGVSQKDRLADIGADSMDQALFQKIVSGAFADTQALDDMLMAVLNETWTVERLDPVLRALLRASSFEIGQGDEAAPQKLISQYVQIAQGFFEGKEPGLANATLDSLAKSLHPQIFDA